MQQSFEEIDIWIFSSEHSQSISLSLKTWVSILIQTKRNVWMLDWKVSGKCDPALEWWNTNPIIEDIWHFLLDIQCSYHHLWHSIEYWNNSLRMVWWGSSKEESIQSNHFKLCHCSMHDWSTFANVYRNDEVCDH